MAVTPSATRSPTVAETDPGCSVICGALTGSPSICSASVKSTTISSGGFLASAAPPEEYQYDERPVANWTSTNSCGHEPQPATVRFCGVCPSGTVSSTPA